jgi:ABC transporter family protein
MSGRAAVGRSSSPHLAPDFGACEATVIHVQDPLVVGGPLNATRIDRRINRKRASTNGAAPAARTDEAAIAVRDLRKTFGRTDAPRGFSFDVRRGEIFALLARTAPARRRRSRSSRGIESGTRVTSRSSTPIGPADAELARANRPGAPGVRARPAHDRARDGHPVLALLPAPRPVHETTERVGLGDVSDARIGTPSGGQRRRADVAVGIVGDPELIFLDEPTTGFDPSARRAWGHDRGPPPARQDGPSHHALHGRGAASRRPDRHPARRRAGRDRDDGRDRDRPPRRCDRSLPRTGRRRERRDRGRGGVARRSVGRRRDHPCPGFPASAVPAHHMGQPRGPPARGPRGEPPDARGHLPRAHRRGGASWPTSGSSWYRPATSSPALRASGARSSSAWSSRSCCS